jgi:hypothetical protein
MKRKYSDMKRAAHSLTLLSPTLALLLACGCSADDESSGTMTDDSAVTDANKTLGIVSGPVTGGTGKPFSTSVVDVAPRGYTETEFLYEGDASAYAVQGAMTMDGRWNLTEASKAHFKSRMIVRRPKDASKFNGTVVVEWLNVSGGADGDPGYMYTWEEILRGGYVWVGVSAQAQGIEGGGFSLLANPPLPLKTYDSERYGTLKHPGDAYSYDIFTRAAQIIRASGKNGVLQGLVPKRLIGYGESQSAGRLVSYVNGVHPLVKAFDGYFIHSRGAAGTAFSDDLITLLAGFISGSTTVIRDDIDAKVFQFQTETDVVGYLAARQPDSDRIRTWEVAGTAHADQHILDINMANSSGGVSCNGANQGPQHFVIKAALHALNQWMTDGTAPVSGELLMVENGTPLTDENGNTLGGIRTPSVDVPIATLSGQPAAGSTDFVCVVFGQTIPFTSERLLELYPTHDDYVTKFRDSARAAREAKFLLPPEEKAMVDEAEAALVPDAT